MPSTTAPSPLAAPARKIILDTDPGVDDVLAILLALASPELDVRLISIVFGNTHAPTAHANLLKIYALLEREVAAFPAAQDRFGGFKKVESGRGDTKLAIGGDGPVGGEKATAAYFHGKDGLSNLSESHPEFTPPAIPQGTKHAYLDMDDRPSWEVMLEVLEQETEGSVVIVALGPLTNLAQALRLNPQTFARVSGVVWMGGALDRAGNTSPSAEFNCFADPYAAAEILAAAKTGLFPLIMAPLDITTPHDVPFSDLIHPAVAEAARKAHHHQKAVAIPLSTSGDSAAEKGTATTTAVLEPPAPAEEVPPAPSAQQGPGQGRKWAAEPTPIEAFVSAMLLRVRGIHVSFKLPDAMEMHDPVAVWYALCAASLPALGTRVRRHSLAVGRGLGQGAEGWAIRQRDFQVERVGELTRGMCVVDRRGTGESGGEERTKGTLGTGEDLESESDEDEEEEEGEGKLVEANGAQETGDRRVKRRKVQSGIAPVYLPWVIEATPGKEVLRELLLTRIFGYQEK